MLFSLGEVRQVGIEVIGENQDFTIETADYEILTKDNTVVESGSATIDVHKILTLFSANEIGRFCVEFTYRIGPEILKAKIYLEVR